MKTFIQYFFVIIFFNLSACTEDCDENISEFRNTNYSRSDSLSTSWEFVNNNHYSGDNFLIVFQNGDLCSSTDTTTCNTGAKSFGVWYQDSLTLYFTTCTGVNNGIITQTANFTLINDTLKLFNISHPGGVFGRDTNIMRKIF